MNTNTCVNTQPLEVAVGVIQVDQGYLVAKRLAEQTMGGKWEFPGGKLEFGETPYDALCRELDEEIGIQVRAARPLIQVPYQRGALNIRLHVWLVTQYQGKPKGMLGQTLACHSISQLRQLDFPEANQFILRALQLPEKIAICNMQSHCIEDSQNLAKFAQAGVRFRKANLDDVLYQDRVYKALFDRRDLCVNPSPLVVLDFCDAWTFKQIHALRIAYHQITWGFHLTAQDAEKIEAAQLGQAEHARLLLAFDAIKQLPGLIGMSCHTAGEIQRANRLGVDYLFVSPVAATPTHPEAVPLGWDGFSQLIERAQSPVYALGGMQLAHLSESHAHYAQGIAGLSWWRD